MEGDSSPKPVVLPTTSPVRLLVPTKRMLEGGDMSLSLLPLELFADPRTMEKQDCGTSYTRSTSFLTHS